MVLFSFEGNVFQRNMSSQFSLKTKKKKTSKQKTAKTNVSLYIMKGKK